MHSLARPMAASRNPLHGRAPHQPLKTDPSLTSCYEWCALAVPGPPALPRAHWGRHWGAVPHLPCRWPHAPELHEAVNIAHEDVQEPGSEALVCRPFAHHVLMWRNIASADPAVAPAASVTGRRPGNAPAATAPTNAPACPHELESYSYCTQLVCLLHTPSLQAVATNLSKTARVIGKQQTWEWISCCKSSRYRNSCTP